MEPASLLAVISAVVSCAVGVVVLLDKIYKPRSEDARNDDSLHKLTEATSLLMATASKIMESQHRNEQVNSKILELATRQNEVLRLLATEVRKKN